MHYGNKKPLILACDESSYGLGAVLSHIMVDGSERPITFSSRTLSKAEQNYSQIKKECWQLFLVLKSSISMYMDNHFKLLPITSLFRSIMKQSELVSKYHKTKNTKDYNNYKKQRNFCSKLYI